MNPNTALISTVKGFLDPEEGRRLYEVALEACRLGPCLEVGSYCGKSALYLGAACRRGGAVLFSVDHHRGSEEQQPGEDYFDPALYDPRSGRIDTLPFFRSALEAAGLEETVVPIVSSSHVAARAWATPLGLVFIDGGHAYETALSDYRCWSRHIVAGGYLLIHDIFENPQEGGQAPYRVYRTAAVSGVFHEVERTKSLGVLKRRG
jgi:predicted O-methyltransferase YrrM